MRRLGWLLAVVCAACGGGDTPATPDAGLPDASPDAPAYAACREFTGATHSVPAHIVSSLAAPDVLSPQCTDVDAPFGIESAGPDSVIPLHGLSAGTAYVVRLQSAEDLAFYVSTGCSTTNGPSATECPLFVDASTGNEEVGRFVATGPSAYVVVDYYASATPPDQQFTLDVYAEACTSDASCSSPTGVCSDGRCVECADEFDCGISALPLCDTALSTCVAGVDACDTDDASEPVDDGPAGAFQFTVDGTGAASTTGLICSSPRSEADFFSFQVETAGEIWDISLTWSGTRDLDLEVYDSHGLELGLSYWEQPEAMRLTYLAPGTYYVRVSDFSNNVATSVPYTLSIQRSAGTACTTRSDCAASYRNQTFRGDCQAGACVPLNGNGAVAAGGACDSLSDCASGLACPSFYFVADADTRDVCAPTCTDDAGCAALGSDYVCTGYLIQNMCVQKCASDEHCPVATDSEPTNGPWYRLRCQQSTGRCMP